MSKRNRRGKRVRLTVIPQERRIIDQGRAWFVVRTLPQAEQRARVALHLAGFDTWLPKFHERVARRGKVHLRERQLFVRYVFVGLDPKNLAFGFVKDADGVHSILGAPEPVRISGALIQRVADRLTGPEAKPVIKPDVALEIGQLMRVTEGPFASFMAKVTALLGAGRVKVEVDIFGRPTPVEFDPAELRAA